MVQNDGIMFIDHSLMNDDSVLDDTLENGGPEITNNTCKIIIQ